MPVIVTADRAVASVTATESEDWQVVSTPTGFRGITSADFADNDKIAGFVIFENGEDYEVYDSDDDATTSLLEVSNISGTVTITRPATPYKSSNGGARVTAGAGTHTLVVGLGSGSAKRVFRETNTTVTTFSSGDATPSVANYRLFKTNGSTAITAFDDMESGKLFTVRRGDADIVLTHGASIVLPGAVNLTLTASEPAAWFWEEAGVAYWIGGSGRLRADLASTENGKGASLVGIEDSAGLFAASTVEGALAELRGQLDVVSIDESDVGGDGDDITLTLTNGPALADGLTLSFLPSAANTGAVTINYNAGGAVSLVNEDGDALEADDLTTTGPVFVRYDSDDTTWRLVSGMGGLAVDAPAILVTGGTANQTLQSKLRGVLVDVRDFGVLPNTTNDYSTEMQAAIDELAAETTPEQGGNLLLPPGIMYCSGLIWKDFVSMQGVGGLASVLRTPDGADEPILTIPVECAGFTISDIVFDGNGANQTPGIFNAHGILIEETSNTGGNSFVPYAEKDPLGGVIDDTDAYKHGLIQRVHCGQCRGDGIHKGQGYGFQMQFDQIVCAYNYQHGAHMGGSDFSCTNFWLERNQMGGLVAFGGAQKYVNGKVIWNNRAKLTQMDFRDKDGSIIKTIARTEGWANVNCLSPSDVNLISGVAMLGVEAQDGFGDGFYIRKCRDSIFEIQSNRNGYKFDNDQTQSSEEHANFVFESTERLTVIGKSYTYETVVSPTDSLWTTEYPYRIVGANTFSFFEISTDGKTNTEDDATFTPTLYAFDNELVVQDVGTADLTYRLWRTSPSGETRHLDIFQSGTANVQHRFTDDSDTTMNAFGGDLVIGNPSKQNSASILTI